MLAIPELAEMDDEADGHARRDEIHALVAARLLGAPASEWLALFAEHDIWAGPVYSYPDVVDDPQVRHNGSLVTYRHPTEGKVTTPGFAIRFSSSPSSVRRGAPLAGEHTREIHGYVTYSEPGRRPHRLASCAAPAWEPGGRPGGVLGGTGVAVSRRMAGEDIGTARAHLRRLLAEPVQAGLVPRAGGQAALRAA